jgi:MarR family transcriptional regulator, organic hydroperoxide resistance regulator
VEDVAVVTPPQAGEPTLADLLCFDLYAASRTLTQRYRPLLDRHGLTYPQWLVLVSLWSGSPRTVKELSRELRLDHGTLTPLLRRMESNGLLTRERSAADERFVQIALTTAGESLRAEAAAIHCEIGESLGLTATQVLDLQQCLRSLAGRG